MKDELEVTIAGAELRLLADHALYWPARGLLCIADAHFGKAAAYRALGQPVPAGTTSDNLQRLDALLARYLPERLVFLGDFLHAPKSHAPMTLAALSAWRQRHAALHCTLILGNHDVRAGLPPASLRFEIVEEPLLLEPFALRHLPVALPGWHVIAGHEHPVYLLRGRGRQRLRLPCFYSDEVITVLPAFGAFTGGHRIERPMHRRVWVTDGQTVGAVGRVPSRT